MMYKKSTLIPKLALVPIFNTIILLFYLVVLMTILDILWEYSQKFPSLPQFTIFLGLILD